MSKILSLLLIYLIFLLMPTLATANDIAVVGLFHNKVVIKQSGIIKVVVVGSETKDGIKVISANSKRAVISINGGQPKKYGLSTSISAQYTENNNATVHISKDSHGMYRTTGFINGSQMDFLVDTGATFIALNAQHAKKLNIDYKKIGKETIVETASGQTKAYAIMLDKVRVGDINVRNIEALVIDSDSPKVVLLGMSFLKRVKMKNNLNVLELSQKF